MEYLAEYDRGEVATQATLRIMRRSGIVAGVNAPPVPIEDPPLETASTLLLRLKRAPRHIEAVEAEGGGKSPLLPPPGSVAQIFPRAKEVRQIVKRRQIDEKENGGEEEGGGESTLPEKKERKLLDDRDRQKTETNRSPRETSPRTLPAPASFSSKPSGSGVGAAGGRKRSQEHPTGTGTPSPPAAAANVAPAAAADKRQGATPSSRGKNGPKNRGGRKRSSGAFEVDLLRFRSVENIRGWKLGAPGGECLASDFSNGACPRLSVLRLGWCLIGDRGARAIVRSLCSGGGAAAAGRTLRVLDLRGNAVTALGAGTLGTALAAGGLPALRDLDLGSNALRDEGGRAVAHHLFAGLGTWPRLCRLDLSGNGMGDGGVEAIFKAVTAPGGCLSPAVERISVRDNFVSRGARERTSSAPSFLLM